MKLVYTFSIYLLLSFKGFSQYTETINSNRPGSSQGAFAVGKNVLQFEIGAKTGKFTHGYLDDSTINEFQFNYAIRYGVFKNKLEVILQGKYNKNKTENKFNSIVPNESFLNKQTLGFKYLVFDPFKNKKWHSVSLLSWNKNNKIQLTDFIPALSIYAGVNYTPKRGYQYDDPFSFLMIYGNEKSDINPKISLITQNHFIGKWVLVNNITFDRIGDEKSIFNYIFTLIHNFKNPKWSSFVEIEMIKNNIYADNYYKFGAAYLLNKNFQFDTSLGSNIKNSPKSMYFKIGMSTRLDWYRDEVPIDKEKLNKEIEEKRKLKNERKDFKKSDKKERKLIKKANRKK